MSIDPADELRVAQQRHRRRMLLVLGAAAVAVAAFVVALVVFTRPGPLLPRVTKPYLFEVTGPGAAQPSYLFGTFHIAYSVDELPAVVRATQDRCATTVLESDLEARAADDTPAPSPTPPRDRLDDAEWAKLSKMTGLPESDLENESTSHLVGAALSSVLPRVEAMDRGFQRRAREQGKQLAFLETRTLEEVMDGVPHEGQTDAPTAAPTDAPPPSPPREGPLLDGLRDIIAHRGAFRAELLKMSRHYASGDDRACGGAMMDLTSGLNDAWITKIEEHVRRGNAFIAIGCGHLAGDASIIARLRAHGFTVTRIER